MKDERETVIKRGKDEDRFRQRTKGQQTQTHPETKEDRQTNIER